VRFDSLWKESQATAADAEAVLPMVPEGTHVGTVKWVKWDTKDEVKSSDNKDGTVLLVLVDVHGYKPFWSNIPAHYRGKIEALCRAASIDTPDPSVDWDEQELKGRAVTVDVLHAISRAGNQYVKVEKWKPGPKPLPAAIRKAPPRTPAQKADAAVKAAGGDDDIPF